MENMSTRTLLLRDRTYEWKALRLPSVGIVNREKNDAKILEVGKDIQYQRDVHAENITNEAGNMGLKWDSQRVVACKCLMVSADD